MTRLPYGGVWCGGFVVGDTDAGGLVAANFVQKSSCVFLWPQVESFLKASPVAHGDAIGFFEEVSQVVDVGEGATFGDCVDWQGC